MTWFLDKSFLEGLDLAAYDPAAIARIVGVTPAQAAACVDPARRYMVQSAPDYGWLAGANGDRKPCLLFIGGARFANQADHALNFVSFDLPSRQVTHHAADIDLEESSWDDILEVAEEEVGFMHVGDCPVLAFRHPAIWHIAVLPFPAHIHEAVTGGDAKGVEGARAWIERGSFVVYHANDYYLSAEGEVESS